MKRMTRDEFIAYQRDNRSDFDELVSSGRREVKPCDCESDDCQGWQLAFVDALTFGPPR